MLTLTIYTKPDCPLCEHAEAEFRANFPRIAVRKVDISNQQELLTRYAEKVPVFFWGGSEIGHWRLPLAKLRNLLGSG